MRHFQNKQRGAALLAVFFICIMLFAMLCALSQFSLASARTAEKTRIESKLEYAAESGIARLRHIIALGIKRDGINWIADKYSTFRGTYEKHDNWGHLQQFNWLPQQTGERSEFVTDASGYYRIGGTPDDAKVRTRIIKLEPDKTDKQSWYLLVAQATDGKQTQEARLLCTLQSSFARFARFVSNGALSIRSGAEYLGNVYAQFGITCNNESPIEFHEEVITAATVSLDSGATFHKGKVENAPTIPLPGYTDIEAVKNTLAQSSGCEYWGSSPADLIFDYKNAEYAAYFKQYTGYTLNQYADNSITVEINFRRDVMDVTHKYYTGSGYIQFTKYNQDIPHGQAIWVRGYTRIKGDISRRVTLYTQRRDGGNGGITYVTGALRYVNDLGDPMYSCYSAEGYKATFDAASRTWCYNAEWHTPRVCQDPVYPLYQKTPGWTVPDSGGPVLGVVCCKGIYIDANKLEHPYQARNLEIHAVLYSAESRIEARYFTSQGYNLIINGASITTTGNVLATSFRWRNYMYDRNLMTAAPPKFPGIIAPAYGCYKSEMIHTPTE